jgi:hypothetical protein
MAEKQEIIIEVEIDNKTAQKRAAELNKQLIQQREELKKLNKSIKDSNGVTEEQAKKQNELKQKIAETSKELRRENNVAKANQNSLAALKAENSKLTAEIDNLNTGTEEGAKRFQELTSKIADNTKRLKKAEEAQENYRRNVGNYTNSIKDAIGETQFFGTSLNGLEDGFKQGVGGAKAFVKSLFTIKGALIATGVGAFVVILGTLFTFFTKTQKGARALEKALGFLGGVIGKLIGDIAKIGELIFDTFSGKDTVLTEFGNKIIDIFTNPVDSLKELGSLILNNIINRLKSALVFGEAISKLFEGEFSEAAKLAADAAIQLTTGVEGATDKIIEGAKVVGEYSEELFEAGKQGFNLAGANIAIRDSIRALTVAQAEATRAAEEQRKIRDDERLSLEERLEANRKADEFEKQRLEAQKRIVQARLQLLQNERKVSGDLSEEQLDEQAELQQELALVEEDALTRRTETLTNEVSLRREVAAQVAQIEIDKANAVLSATEEGSKKELEAQKSLLAAQRDADIVAAENEIANKEAQNAKKLAIEAQFKRDLKDLDLEFEGEKQEREAKARALQIEQRKEQLERDLETQDLSFKEILAKRQEQVEVERDIELNNTELTEQQKKAIIEKAERDKLEIVKDVEKSKLQVAAQGLEIAARLAKEGSVAQKAFAIGAATINTILAVQNALATVQPYPLAIVAAVGAGITGAANVAKIAGVEFEQGGSLQSGGTEGTKQNGSTDNLLGYASNIGAFRS